MPRHARGKVQLRLVGPNRFLRGGVERLIGTDTAHPFNVFGGLRRDRR
jgi:hypothetical protein